MHFDDRNAKDFLGPLAKYIFFPFFKFVFYGAPKMVTFFCEKAFPTWSKKPIKLLDPYDWWQFLGDRNKGPKQSGQIEKNYSTP